METPQDDREEQEQEQEVIGAQHLKLRKGSSKFHQPTHTNTNTNTTNSDTNFTTHTTSFEQNMDTNTTTTTTTNNNNNNNNNTTNGENFYLITPTVIDEEIGTHIYSEEPINKSVKSLNGVAVNGESNGSSKELNGNGIVEYPLPESNEGDEASEFEAITPSFSKSPETAVGLKYVESLLDESPNGVNGTASEIYNADNIVNKTLIVSSQSEIVQTGDSQEVELVTEEYEVERVIRKQETHDLICPYCNHDITKRVILKRRKRKIEHISGGVEESRIKSGPTAPNATDEDLDVDERKSGDNPFQVKGSPGGTIDAISCFSCFSIFVPKGDGFLWWRFKPKQDVTSQTDDSPAVSMDQSEPASKDKREVFPLWILTCCQPYDGKRPVSKIDLKPPLRSEDGKEAHLYEREFPALSSHDTSELSRSQSSITPNTDPETLSPPTPKNSVPATLTPEGKDNPLWIFTCCQPSERTKPEHAPKPGADVPSVNELYRVLSDDKPVDPIHRPISLEPDTPSPTTKHSTPIKPVDEPILPLEEQPLVTPNKVKDSSLWFLACCQPDSEGKIQKHSENTGQLATSSQKVSPLPSCKDKLLSPTQPSVALDHDKLPSPTQPSVAPDHANTKISSKTSVSTKPSNKTPILQSHGTQPVAAPAGGTTFPIWFVTCCQPSSDSNEAKHATKQEETVPSNEFKAQPSLEGGTNVLHHDKISPTAPSNGTEIQNHDTEPPCTQSSEKPVSPTPEPPIISEPRETILLPKPLPPIKPDDDIPSPPEPEAPAIPRKDEVSVIPVPREQPIPQPSDTPPITSETGPRHDIEQPSYSREPATAGVSGLDIIKAIVYGGLLECIASLSVITSAAGGDATTLNIVALGLANVFGGLVVLLHNLRVLKHEHTIERYTEQLGRPGHFLLHAFVAVLSYLTFGLMSPIIYGFAFRKSDSKDYKLATLASASLLCITILSIGKAYVQRPPKTYFQTVFYYICMGFLVSGVGYVAGDLVNMFLKKLDVFDSRESPAAMNGWATY